MSSEFQRNDSTGESGGVAAGLSALARFFFVEIPLDFARFSWSRIWAISSVCFQESIRRRILWITPLTIVAVVIISQLQKPFDEQDAIRQTIKYCLFASGTLVVLTAVILAATNLPKEIESRVIYTLVTKPVTRLEIVLGKVVGFARVSGSLLLIMGVFTYAYAQWRAAALVSEVRQRLVGLPGTDASRPTFEHYANDGLLHAKTYGRPVDLEQLAEVPPPLTGPLANDQWRWINGGDEQSFIVPFDLPTEVISLPEDGTAPEETAIEIQLDIRFRPRQVGGSYSSHQWPPSAFPSRPLLRDNQPPFLPTTSSAVNIAFLGADRFSLFSPTELPQGGGAEIKTQTTGPVTVLAAPTRPFDPLMQQPEKPAGYHRIWVQVSGADPRMQYAANASSVRLRSRRLELLLRTGRSTVDPVILPVRGPDGKPYRPHTVGRTLLGGQQLRGVADPSAAVVAIFPFRGMAAISAGAQGTVPVELRFPIEGTGDESASGKEVISRASLEVFNLKTGKTSTPVIFPMESNRTLFTNVPADALSGGNFDIRLRCLAPGNTITLRMNSVAVVASEHSFLFNLCKSLLVLWLMSLLVVTAAIFCSTFVSWPIAVVMTVLILLGRWGIDQLGDATGPGIGNVLTKELFPGTDPAAAKTISSSIEGLSTLLNRVSYVLPDISAFSATEEIERGINVPWMVLLRSGGVLLLFGCSMTLLAYIILKKKEVAP